NEPDKLLSVLEPPPGGLTRLRARRDSRVRRPPPWWALAAGVAAAIVWMTVTSGGTTIRLQLSGARLIGERSQNVGGRLLDGGRAVSVPSSDANVRIYWIEPTPAHAPPAAR